MNQDWSKTKMVDPLDHGQALTAGRGTCSAGRPFIALHRKQPGEQLKDKDLIGINTTLVHEFLKH